ncbi:neprilysin-1 [Dermacentor silvarum]|nr:neprilysin-1 [Dermacentor silvarum]
MKPTEAAPRASDKQAQHAKAGKEKTGSRKGPKHGSLPARHLKQRGASHERDVIHKRPPEGHGNSISSPTLRQTDAKVHTIRPPFARVTKGSKPPNVVEASATQHHRRPSRVSTTERAPTEGIAVVSLPGSQVCPSAGASAVSLPVSQAGPSGGASAVLPSSPTGLMSPLLSGNIMAFPMEAAFSPPNLPRDQIAEEGPKPPAVSGSLKFCLTFSLCVLTVILISTVVVLAIKTYLFSEAPSSNVCKTHACLAYSKRLLSSIDDSVNPCKNFTRFVCGGWQKANSYSVWENQFQSVLNKLSKALNSIDVPSSGQHGEQRAAAVYRSCIAILEGSGDELAAVKKALDDAGIVWPQPSSDADVPRTLLYVALKLGWDVLLDFDVTTLSDGSTVELFASIGKLLLFVVKKLRRLRANGGGEVYFDFLRERFRRNDTDSVTYEQMHAIEIYALQTVKYSLGRTVTAHRVESFLDAPDIGLTEAKWMAALGAINVSVATRVSVTSKSPEFVESVLRVWRWNGSDSFHTFVSYCTVQVAALFANGDLIQNYYDEDYPTTKAYHQLFCVTRAMFFSIQAPFARYNADVLKGNAGEVARNMSLSVRNAFSRRLSNWTYFDESITVVDDWSSLAMVFFNFERHTGEYGSKKRVQLPDTTDSFVNNWKQSVLIRNPPEVDDTMQSVYKLNYYIILYSKRDFQLMPYALSYPLFDSGLPSSVNYGGLGSEIAKALGSLFLYFYSNVSESQSMIECMREGSSISKGRWYAEQAIGLGALVDAYDSVVRRASDSAVQGLEKYSGLQLIFIALCYLQCRGQDAKEAGESVCDKPLRHVPEFAEAFGCALGDPMNPPNRCPLL